MSLYIFKLFIILNQIFCIYFYVKYELHWLINFLFIWHSIISTVLHVLIYFGSPIFKNNNIKKKTASTRKFLLILYFYLLFLELILGANRD